MPLLETVAPSSLFEPSPNSQPPPTACDYPPPSVPSVMMGQARIWSVDPGKVISETLDGEAVIVDLASGRYHAAAGVAATVWEGMRLGFALDRIMSDVRRAYTAIPDDAEASVQTFIDAVVDAGLAVPLQAAESAADDHASVTVGPRPWSVPVLESHDDLADLMLIDPVHDVTEVGWPHARPASG